MILQAAQRDPQGWLLEKLPWESADMQTICRKSGGRVGYAHERLVVYQRPLGKFAQLTAAIESPEPGAQELLSYVSTLFKE